MSEITDQADEVRHLADAAIARRQMGTDHGVDVSWVAAQTMTPAGPAPVVIYQLLITRRSPLIGGGPLFHIAQIASPRPAEKEVDDAVADGMRMLAATYEALKKPPAAPPARPAALMNGARR